MTEQLKRQLTKEIRAVNRTFQAFNIMARTTPALTAIGGDQLVIYRLQAHPGQAISKIDSLLPELSEAISHSRRQQTLVRLLRYPLRLETTHPYRKPLQWSSEALGSGQPHALLLGRAYDNGGRDLWLPFDNAPHVLVAGATGAGKSVEIANMLLGLCWHTSPADVRVVLIDMKNTDLVPFARLPHVDRLATDTQPAFAALREAGRLLKRRQANHTDTPRLLIVVDEYTDLVGDSEAMSHADRIARQGRSAGIHMLIATQHPTSKALGGATIKNNFLTRCIGQVADASAASNAAGRPGTHAELLPGKGAFLMVHGLDATRFQSYYLDEIAIESLVTRIGRKWRSEPSKIVLESSSTLSSSTAENPSSTRVRRTVEEVEERVVEEKVEELSARDEIDEIADMIAEMHGAGASKNAMSKHAFGKPFGGSHAAKIDAAIERLNGREQPQNDDKIIKLRKTG